ncbi:MAG: hypothetical protein QOH56_859 [Pseudonocardiales bacterium]|jgi:hypothetical protein|nr:hypothetical protein [Pseudonocardiales bacterium]
MQVSGSTVVSGAGAFLDGSVCEPLWRLVNDELSRRRRDGGQVRTEIAQAVETLRLAASTYLALSRAGQIAGTSPDIGPLSEHAKPRRDLSTAELAALLHVTPRHARRLATEHGLTPTCPSPYRWSRIDVAALIDSYAQQRAS